MKRVLWVFGLVAIAVVLSLTWGLLSHQTPSASASTLRVSGPESPIGAIPFPGSCHASNQCLCCTVSCSGSSSCIVGPNYVSCDGVTRKCGLDCC
jgi:hypothetical protein